MEQMKEMCFSLMCVYRKSLRKFAIETNFEFEKETNIPSFSEAVAVISVRQSQACKGTSFSSEEAVLKLNVFISAQKSSWLAKDFLFDFFFSPVLFLGCLQ